MFDIPFPLETVPADKAESALARLQTARPGVIPVLLGDADVFSTEWAEVVDDFEDPEGILGEARELDVESWFRNRIVSRPAPLPEDVPEERSGFSRMAAIPVDVILLPVRLIKWPLAGHRGKPEAAPEPPGDYLVDMLRAQLAELESAGEGTDEELAEIREVIDGIAADGAEVFPDPIAYVTPRRGQEMAAGLLNAAEPWECAAWLQHGAYAICAPKAVFVAHCRWLWQTYGARIITASTDHVGFQMDRPIEGAEAANEVLARFGVLGATEINGDKIASPGKSLVGAHRLWVWWD